MLVREAKNLVTAVGSGMNLRSSGNFELRNTCFLFFVVIFFLWSWRALLHLVTLSFQNDNYQHYSHISLIPFLTVYLLYLKRTAIFARMEWRPLLGSTLMILGAAVRFSAHEANVGKLEHVLPAMLSVVMTCWGAFLFCYGPRAFREASLGLGLLIFMVPFPSFFLDAIIGFLQRSSAEASALLFSVLSVPVFRDGFVFSLSNFTIHVAEECSGIRSTLALFITGLVAGHLFLRSFWAKVGLVSIVIPLAIVKNAVRIVGLALLANYVDPAFITDSALHRNGGIPLFLVSLGMLFSVVWLLRMVEKRFGYDLRDRLRAET